MVLLGPLPGSQAATSLAAIVDATTQKVVVFNSSTDTVLSSSAAAGIQLYGCKIVGSKVFFTSYDNILRSASFSGTPALGATISTPDGLGLALTSVKKGKTTFIVTSGGAGTNKLVVVNTAKRREVHTLTLTGVQEAQRASDGSILSADYFGGIVNRLVMSSTGALSTRPALTGVVGPINVITPKVGHTSLVLSANGASSAVESFAMPGMTFIHKASLADNPYAGVASPDGTKIYVLSVGHLYGFNYDPNSGVIGSSLFSPIAITTSTLQYFGVDQLGLDPTGQRLYVPVSGGEHVFSATSGADLGTMTGSGLSSPAGICFPGQN